MHPLGVVLFFMMLIPHSLVISCSSDSRCKCVYNENWILADCSHLDLHVTPYFNDSVRAIDLSYNHLKEIAKHMPLTIEVLVLSFNNMEYPNTSVLSEYRHLKVLHMDHNCLWRKNGTWPPVNVFKNLHNLEDLNIIDDCPSLCDRQKNYSHGSFHGLFFLRHLRMNGLGGANFVDAFDEVNNIQTLELIGEPGLCNLDYMCIRENTFAVFHHLTNLSLQFCKIHTIELGSFSKMMNLTYLDISNNEELTIDVLKNVTYDLRSSNIRTLKANKLQCEKGLTLKLSTDHLQFFKSTPLEELSLAANRIASIDITLLRMMPTSLRVLNMSDNIFYYDIYVYGFIAYLENLEVLDISVRIPYKTLFSKLNFFCNDIRFPRTLSENNIDPKSIIKYQKYTETYYLPRNLRKLYLNNLRLNINMTEQAFSSNNSLTHLEISGNFFDHIRKPIGFRNLKHLDYSRNYCKNIFPFAFQDELNLIYLNLSENHLREQLQTTNSVNAFQKLRKLEVLDISYNWLNSLPKNMFLNCKNMKSLYLRSNHFQTITFDTSPLFNLSLLDLSNNEINFFDEKEMENLDSNRRTILNINLLGNRLLCSCKSIKFLEWMYLSRHQEFVHRRDYMCLFTNGTAVSLKNIEYIVWELKTQCASYTVLICVLISVLLAFVTGISIGIIYRYRWTLRYLYYAGKQTFYKKSYLRIPHKEPNYRFDCFIAYADQRIEKLKPNLEQMESEHGLKFCIPDRDFIPGANVVDNITNAIISSKRMVCFIDSNFLECEWCTCKVQMARVESAISRDGKNILYLVLMENKIIHLLPKHLINVINAQSYIDFDPYHNDEFWNVLAQNLKDVN